MTREGAGETSNVISGGTQYGPVLQGGQFINPTFVTGQAAAAPVALAQLPALVTGFTGREPELAQIARLLDPAANGGAVVVSAVAGLAGVGKTALAIHAGHAATKAGWFPGGVLFIDLHGYDQMPVQPGQSLDALLRALGIAGEHIPEETEQRAGLYRSALAQVPGPVLIIADNASAEAQVRPLLPGPGPHRVIVTSRHTLAGLGARLLDVTVLDQAAAVTLLDQALRAARPGDDRIGGDPAATQRLGKACGGLPLALQITAALLAADPALTVGELAGTLADEVGRLEMLRYDDGSGIGAPSVAAAFELSYRQLDADTARLFRLLPANPGPDVSTAAAAVLDDRLPSETRSAIGRLVKAHLLEPGNGPAGRWRTHDLLHLYARQLSGSSPDEQEQAQSRLLNYYRDRADAADARLRALAGAPVTAEFAGRDDALAWLDAERPNLIAAVIMAASTDHYLIAMDLPARLSTYLKWRRQFDDLLTLLTAGRDVARRQGDQAAEGAALNNLGVALKEMRRFDEAINTCREAVAIFRDTGNRNGEGSALTNLGLLLSEARRFDEAIGVCREAIAIFRGTGNRHDEGAALNNLGAALRGVWRFDEAISAHQAAAEIYRETGDQNYEGSALDGLGSALQGALRFDEAISAHQAAAEIYRETGDRHGEGGALTNLGLVFEILRRFDEAISAHQAAAEIYRETGDRHHEGVALSNLGGALRGAQRFDEAISAGREAAEICRETGDRHGEGLALGNLGSALQGVLRFDEAIGVSREALEIFRETGDRRGEGAALNALGAALLGMGRFDEAIGVCREAAESCRETGDRRGEGLALGNLGGALQGMRRFDDEAVSAHQAAAAIYREVGDEASEAIELNNLGTALLEMRRFDEAISPLRDAVKIYRKAGDRHSEGETLANLGAVLQGMRRFDEAISVCQDALAILRETGNRQGTAIALNNLGEVLREVRRPNEAVNAFRDAIVIFREVGDRYHEGVAQANLEAAQCK